MAEEGVSEILSMERAHPLVALRWRGPHAGTEGNGQQGNRDLSLIAARSSVLPIS